MIGSGKLSRRTLVIRATALVGTGVAAACGAPAPTQPETSKSAGPPADLTMMLAQGDVVPTGQKVAALLSEQNLGFRIEPLIYKNTEELVAKQLAGDTSDLVFMEITSVALKFNGGFVQLD